jgi:bifunctional polynucleotide phosphatase/kinase
MTWEILDESVIHLKSDNFKFRNKIACFDIDGTLIKTKSGKAFPINGNDWVWLYDKIILKIQELSKNKYCIIFISNQFILKTDEQLLEWQGKINKMIQEIDIPVLVYASRQKDKFRKPIPLIWRKYILPNIKKINYDESFYCGDAMGRKEDHSDCDIKFAHNCNLTFVLPEELFLNHPIIDKHINYIDLPKNNFDESMLNKFTNLNKIMIIMVGYPASGKSFVANILEKNKYIRINQDTLKTKKKCLDKTLDCLKKDLNCIIDNTNPTKDKRKEYIDLAKKYNYNVYCINMTTSYELSQHNNIYRYWKYDINPIPTIVYNKFRKEYEEPSSDELYTEIINTSCALIDDPDYKLYLMV